jgi:hypothetical protein
MEILLDKRSARQIRQSALDAVEDGDTETLREDVMDAFNEDQIEEIERRIDSGDFYDFIGDALEQWDGDDVDELFELLESHLADVGVELKYRGAKATPLAAGSAPKGDADDEDDDFTDDDDDDDDDDDGTSEGLGDPMDIPDADADDAEL